jgi:hypothetical protein
MEKGGTGWDWGGERDRTRKVTSRIVYR